MDRIYCKCATGTKITYEKDRLVSGGRNFDAFAGYASPHSALSASVIRPIPLIVVR